MKSISIESMIQDEVYKSLKRGAIADIVDDVISEYDFQSDVENVIDNDAEFQKELKAVIKSEIEGHHLIDDAICDVLHSSSIIEKALENKLQEIISEDPEIKKMMVNQIKNIDFNESITKALIKKI